MKEEKEANITIITGFFTQLISFMYHFAPFSIYLNTLLTAAYMQQEKVDGQSKRKIDEEIMCTRCMKR